MVTSGLIISDSFPSNVTFYLLPGLLNAYCIAELPLWVTQTQHHYYNNDMCVSMFQLCVMEILKYSCAFTTSDIDNQKRIKMRGNESVQGPM